MGEVDGDNFPSSCCKLCVLGMGREWMSPTVFFGDGEGGERGKWMGTTFRAVAPDGLLSGEVLIFWDPLTEGVWEGRGWDL